MSSKTKMLFVGALFTSAMTASNEVAAVEAGHLCSNASGTPILSKDTVWNASTTETQTSSTDFINLAKGKVTFSIDSVKCIRIRLTAETTVPAGEAIEVQARFTNSEENVFEATPGTITWAKAGAADEYSVVSFQWIGESGVITGNSVIQIKWRSVGGAPVKLGKRTLLVDF
jgi:hypothetical protein